jgi:hypothetical protein
LPERFCVYRADKPDDYEVVDVMLVTRLALTTRGNGKKQ